jgi:hypothetical protein
MSYALPKLPDALIERIITAAKEALPQIHELGDKPNIEDERWLTYSAQQSAILVPVSAQFDVVADALAIKPIPYPSEESGWRQASFDERKARNKAYLANVKGPIPGNPNFHWIEELEAARRRWVSREIGNGLREGDMPALIAFLQELLAESILQESLPTKEEKESTARCKAVMSARSAGTDPHGCTTAEIRQHTYKLAEQDLAFFDDSDLFKEPIEGGPPR